MRNLIWHYMGKYLTPPALFINLFSWLEGVSVNQALMVVISGLVIAYWISRLRLYKIEKQIKLLELKRMQAQDNLNQS